MRSKIIPHGLRVILALLAILIAGEGFTEPILQWQEGNPFAQGHPLRVYYANDLFLAVGESAAIYTSRDGANWTRRNSGRNDPLYDVAYGGGTFLGVGAGGTVLTSSDGIIWLSQNPGTSGLLSGITYGRDIFVAVGDQGLILTSPDGADWTVRNSGTQYGLKKVAFGHDIFVAVGDGGTILTSPDGATWTGVPSGFTGDLRGITYGNNLFVAVGASILTSPDGTTWTERPVGTNLFYLDVAYGRGTLVAVADDGTILTSADGAAWTYGGSGTPSALWTVAHGQSHFVAVGEGGILLQSESLPSTEISASPAAIDFGVVNVGSSSSVNPTITNSGSADVLIQRLAISGPDVIDFIIQNDNCTGITLLPSRNCSVQIIFSPHASGFKSATLSISSNDPLTPTRTVPLSGRGSGSALGTNESFCFISFSALGSELEEYMGILRRFRDIFLMESQPGRMLVALYYRHSPSLVRFIARHDFLRKVVQVGLLPLVILSYLALQTSPAEKTFFFALLTGLVIARRLKMRRSFR